MDEIDTRHELGHGMLDLKARVHLQEIKAALVVDEELDRSGAPVFHGFQKSRRGLEKPLARNVRQMRSGRLFPNLLMPALERALALVQVDSAAAPIPEHLNLDVTRALHEFSKNRVPSPNADLASAVALSAA